MNIISTKRLLLLIVFAFLINLIYSQELTINEIMSSNSINLSDEDGDFPDWIELYNSGLSAINLLDYGLSDDDTLPLKWQFPDISISPQDHLLLFASGKDRTNAPAHWETIVNWGDEWSYFPGTEEPPASWNTVEFDDENWSTGPSGFGYGDDDDATVISGTLSIYIRKEIYIPDISEITHCILHVDFDDAFVAYINGVEIARENIGTIGVPPAFDDVAITYTEPLMAYGNLPFSYVITDFESLLNNGENVIAIQVHNSSSTSSDITLIPFLTFGMKTIPENPNGVPDILLSSLPIYLHTNFKIKANGEKITLSNSLGELIDQVDSTYIPKDYSYGRQDDGTDNWYYFIEPTPNSANITQGYNEISGDPIFSIQGGLFSSSQTLSFTGTSVGSIYYTLDCTEPTSESNLYSSPISIDNTTVVKAKAFGTEALPGRTITKTYIINENFELPVVSISSDPVNLWDNETGIFAFGSNAETNFPHFGANFWEDWEKPIHIEMFKSEENTAFDIDAGMKIFGGWSRGFPQKSLSIFARSDYGFGSIKHQIFDEKPISKFEAVVLRNSGNDWSSTMFRDAMITSLVKDIDIDRQAYCPSVVFMNGEYWGILNFREKVNEHYVESNFPWVDKDNIDLLESNGYPIHGDNVHYTSMIDFISNNDLSIPDYYNYVKTLIDIDEFINYQATQIYCNNQDWPGNNIKFWRPKTEDGKWRWILYDTDFGFGIWNAGDYSANTLAFALDANGPGWPNPPWSTFLFRNLVLNNQFKEDFINRFADLLNTTFSAENVISHIDSIKSMIENEIPDHIERWNVTTMDDWNWNVDNMKNYADSRVSYMQSHIVSQFDLEGTATTTINISEEGAGEIIVNSILLESFPWTGEYFKGVPIQLNAIAKPGYKFVSWSGEYFSYESTINVNLDENLNVQAIFEPDLNNDGAVVINEINYNSADDFDPEDWIELYNNTMQTINLSNWVFQDSDNAHIFEIPENTMLNSGDYLVLCKDTVAFKSHFPHVANYIGNFDFGLSGSGELIRLFDSFNNLIDNVTYSDLSPWPVDADGKGPTLELKNPYFDNNLAESWSTFPGFGTPGALNNFINSLKQVKLDHNKVLLFDNYPNPFSTETNISFHIESAGNVSLQVFDINGRLINTLNNSYLASGLHSFIWNGDNLGNNKVNAGLYFIRIETNDFSQTRKVVLMR